MVSFERVSVRKVGRKLVDDGVYATGVAAAEFAARRVVFKPLVTRAIESGWIQTRSFADVHASTSDGEEPISGGSIVNISNGYVFPSTGLVADHDGQLLLESISSPDSRTSYQAVPIIHHLFRDGVRFTLAVVRTDASQLDRWATDAKVVSPLIPRYVNYFHWLIETLPRIRLIEGYHKKTGMKPTIIIPRDPPQWMCESLDLVVSDTFKIRPASSRLYQPNQTIVTSRAEITRKDCDWLRQRVLGCSPIDRDNGNRIYISRANARDRHVINERELIEELEKYGIKRYALEELSVVEQADLFAGADLVIGPHGAGFSNLVFSEHATVIELFGSKVKSNFDRLSTACGLEYTSINCIPKGTDIKADINQVCDTVENALDEHR